MTRRRNPWLWGSLNVAAALAGGLLIYFVAREPDTRAADEAFERDLEEFAEDQARAAELLEP
jgi:hypothetical protein